MEHVSKGGFRAVVGIRKVLRGWEDNGGFEKASRTEESGKTKKGVVNPLFLLQSDGKPRLGQAKHVTVIPERHVGPKPEFASGARFDPLSKTEVPQKQEQ
jgi:hypothetical protein